MTSPVDDQHLWGIVYVGYVILDGLRLSRPGFKKHVRDLSVDLNERRGAIVLT